MLKKQRYFLFLKVRARDEEDIVTEYFSRKSFHNTFVLLGNYFPRKSKLPEKCFLKKSVLLKQVF